MRIREVIEIINRMQADGVIDSYAIGGAVGATFYLEPIATLDVDVFVPFRSDAGGLLVSPQPIFDYLKARGCTMDGEYMIIAGWPVQFLPPVSPLVAEALEQAIIVDVEGAPARVFSAEHLAAIALQTGRAKDKARLLQFIEADVLDEARFQAVLKRHALVDAWHKFEHQFLGGQP
jgi:hypothetical protein